MKLLAIFVLFGLAAVSTATIVDVLAEQGQDTILRLLELTGLTEVLEGDGPFTAFVPKQEVFDSLPEEVVEAITSDVDALAQILLYHVALGSYLSTDAADNVLLPTAQGADLRVNIYDVDGNTVATVAGVPIDLNNVDIDAGNGIIHFLDFVILNIPIGDTVDTLVNFPSEDVSFEALLYAAESLELVEAIQAGTDITVLAPIDSDGFNTDVVDALLEDPETLAVILQDHIASTVVFSVGIGMSGEYTTLNGNTIVIAFDDVNGYQVYNTDGDVLADVIAGDIPTSQGVLHLLDRPIIL